MSEQSWSVPIGEDDFDAFVAQLIQEEPLPSGVDPAARLTEIRLAMAEAERLAAADDGTDPVDDTGSDQADIVDELADLDDDARFMDEPVEWADDPLSGSPWTDLELVDDPDRTDPTDGASPLPEIDDDPLG